MGVNIRAILFFLSILTKVFSNDINTFMIKNHKLYLLNNDFDANVSLEEIDIKKEKIIKWIRGLHKRSKNKLISGQYMYKYAYGIFKKTGKWPALMETNLWQQNWGSHSSAVNNDGGRYWPHALEHRDNLLKYWQSGGLVSLHMPIPNPKHFSDQFDVSLSRKEYRDIFTPNTSLNENYKIWLGKLAEHLSWLQKRGVIIFIRPLHERGPWFWWGGSGAEPSDYVNLFRYTVKFLKEKCHLHNLIVVYSMHHQHTEKEFYPGSDVVDIIGIDVYKQNNPCASIGKTLEWYAEKFEKPVFITELGWHYQNSKIKPYTKDAYEDILKVITNVMPHTVGWLSWAGNNSPLRQNNCKKLYEDPKVITRKSVDWGKAR